MLSNYLKASQLYSASTLAIYNSIDSVSRFSKFLIDKMKEWKISGIILSLEKEKDNKIVIYLSQIVDRVVEVK
jgi:hypothetical protein